MSLRLHHVNVVEMPRKHSILDADYETERRQKRLRDSQSIDWFVLCGYICSALLIAAWLRILYLASRDLVYWIAIRLSQ